MEKRRSTMEKVKQEGMEGREGRDGNEEKERREKLTKLPPRTSPTFSSVATTFLSSEPVSLVFVSSPCNRLST